MKIIQIVPYFGDCPKWFQYFIESCSHNPEIHWLIYGDIPVPKSLPNNIMFKQSSLAEFSILVSKKLAIDVVYKNAYKLCDLRPAFGKIFEDYIRDYDFWGYSDLDLIYGKISNFIPFESIGKYQIISSRNDYFPGHFILFKNNKLNKNIYKHIFRFSSISKDTYRHYAIDEHSNLIGKAIEGYEEPTIFRRILYKVLKGIPFNHDLNDVLRRRENRRRADFFLLENPIRSDIFYLKKGIENWHAQWKWGKLIDKIEERELMYFHFLKSKSNAEFIIEQFKKEKAFRVDAKGFHVLDVKA